MSKTSSVVKNRYNVKAYDRIALNVKKGKKDEYKAHAESVGKSLNAYVVDLIEKDIETSKKKIVP